MELGRWGAQTLVTDRAGEKIPHVLAISWTMPPEFQCSLYRREASGSEFQKAKLKRAAGQLLLLHLVLGRESFS